MENEDNKFGTVEILLGFFFLALPVDLICILIDLTGVGAAITPFLQGFATFVMRWWFKSHGDETALALNGKQIARYLSNLLPIVPTLTLIFAFDVYAHNNPQSAIARAGKKLERAASMKAGGVSKTKDVSATARALNVPEPIE